MGSDDFGDGNVVEAMLAVVVGGEDESVCRQKVKVWNGSEKGNFAHFVRKCRDFVSEKFTV